MDGPEPIQDDLFLIMQSYVDPPPPPVKPEQQPLAKHVAAESEDSDEDEVEMAIQLEPSDEENAGGAKSLVAAKASLDESDSDSDSSDSDSDVEMRVTKYPARKLPATLLLNDSDVEDDDDAPSGSIAQYAGTKNEVLLPEVKPPELTMVPPEDVLELIGEVMTIIDSVVVIKGYTSGVDRVLDTDSLLAFEDRSVVGVVFETFGAVKQPLYSVRFASASAIDKDSVRVGRQVFHVPTRSNFVFTHEIARIKGSDASNLHDEEVGDDQLDFSDDEAEAQWRRNRKEAKRGQTLSHSYPTHEGTPKQSKPELPTSLPYPVADDGDVPYSTLPYDDAPDPRPTPTAYDPYFEHEEEAPTIPTGTSTQTRTESEPSGSRGRGRDRGRRRGSPNQMRNERHNDDRGRPRRGRGGRGRGRGDRRQGRGGGGGGGNFPNQYPTDYYSDPASMMYAMANATGQYPYVPQDEGYNPVNGVNGYWEQGTMPHINPRFFSGGLGGDASGGFGMQWPNNQGFEYQQPGYGYNGYNDGNNGGYNQDHHNS